MIACCSLHFRPRLNRPVARRLDPRPDRGPGGPPPGRRPRAAEEAERLARERGCWQLTLESGYQRKEAHVMYEAFGMANEGYYFGKPLSGPRTTGTVS